jgi:eukaryotic-like serine/threonine-protein kinase
VGEEALSSELSIGSIFGERYRIERRLAAGGMGTVYEVVHLETNRRRALKVLHAKFMQSDILKKRFRQEARVAAEIESEHIVDIFDAGIDPKTEMPFLVMELLRGEDVRTRIRRDGPLTPEETIRYLYETGLALEKTHKANIVHRDLKPDNLFLCERELGPPRIKVLDFGIAKIVAEGHTETQVTQSLGTPLYMAPEQFSINSAVSPATDIFALGLIAYTMLVGKPYWMAESKLARSPIAFALHAAKGPRESAVIRAAKLDVKLPESFDDWFVRMTAVEPAERPTSVLQAIRELADILGVSMPAEVPSNKREPPPIESTREPLLDISLQTDASESPEAVAEAPQPNASSHSAALLSIRTEGGNESAKAPSLSRPRPILIVGGAMVILFAGPFLDAAFGTYRPEQTVADSASISVAAPIQDEKPNEISSATATTKDSVVAPMPTESASSAPSASASAITKDATKSPSLRPTSSAAKSSNRLIWNND